MIARDDDTLLQFLRPTPSHVRYSPADAALGVVVLQTRARLARVCSGMPADVVEQLIRDVVLFKLKWAEPHRPSLFEGE